LLRVYCSNCENIIKNICKTNQNKRIFKIIDEWLHQITKVPIERIRDVLYNIEQFKGDALKLPEIKPRSFQGNGATKYKTSSKSGFGKNDGPGGPVYGAGAKSAGSMADSTSKGANKMLSNSNQG